MEEPVTKGRMIDDCNISVTNIRSEDTSEAAIKPPDKGKRRKKWSPAMGGKAKNSKVYK